MFERILIPLDPSPESERALEIALDLSRRYHSKILLLSVVDDSAPDAATQRQQAESLGGRVRDRLAQEGLSTEQRIEAGQTAFVICDVADSTDAGLIVMGSRGLGLTEEGLQHSTSDRVINLAPCPVLVVP